MKHEKRQYSGDIAAIMQTVEEQSKKGNKPRGNPEKMNKERTKSEQRKTTNQKAGIMQSEHISDEFIPNEVSQIALKAKTDPAYMLPLWQAVRRLVYSRALIYTKGGKGDRLYDVDDLVQQGYIALSDAVQSYEPKGMQFSGWLVFYLARAFKTAVGTQSDALHHKAETIIVNDEGEEVDLLDLRADDSAEKSLVEIEGADSAAFLIRRINALPERDQSNCIFCVAAGKTVDATAAALQLDRASARRNLRKARYKLWNDPQIRAAYPELFASPRHKGFSAFETSWSSVVEDEILWHEELRSKAEQSRITQQID